MKSKKYSYWHAVLMYVVANLIGAYGVTFFVDIKAVYALLTLPGWAPAVWVFGVVWTINNILVLVGNIWTLNATPSHLRTMLVRLQVASWINYMLFQWFSFGTQMPALFFWPSFTLLILTVASMYYAYKMDTKNGPFLKTVKTGKSITLTFVTLVIWLFVASALGYFIMTHN
jgi:tryptophan-rich sensory protein